MSYEFILTEQKGRVGVATLNRPKQLNALNAKLMQELSDALYKWDADPGIGAMLISGNEKAFAAGADIGAMKDFSYMDAYMADYITRDWEHLRRIRKPVIAAVSGYALGGGNELALMCDIVIAADNARFGQPEINLGVMPGAGGTQRLTRAVGKAVAMDMILSGRMLGAEEARDLGLVARVVAQEAWLEAAKRVAREIAAKSPVSVRLAKDAIDQAFETPLSAGVELERRSFFLARASEDAGEGLSAFVEKRKPDFRGR
jgi:enoyl-CoA hydratase